MDRRAPRIAVPLAVGLLGFLAVLAASNPRAFSRETRRLELADLIRAENGRVRDLRLEVRDLRLELELAAAEAGAAQAGTGALQEDVRRLELLAGTAGVQGPGVVVVLDDSPASRSPTGDPNDLIVHERDIQTVVNALWASGAEAVAIAGEPLTATSAVRCAGNTLLLHGQVHSPPYVISAIGDPEALAADLLARPGMDRLLAAARSFGIELSVEDATVSIPPASASPEVRHAAAAGA
jgi:uncharacterized protein YlxW (UPF0749 family)